MATPTRSHKSRPDVSPDLPLPTLLSHVLVAFTIEFDNEAERQMQHRTTKHGTTAHGLGAGSLHAPWLVSLVMWSNCMRFVGDQGIRIGELEDLAGTKTNLNGMERWGYIVIEPAAGDSRAKPPRSNWLIRATPAGRKAQEIWRPLSGVIEARWQTRFGKDTIDQLRESLWALISQIDCELPDCLPILGYGLFSRVPERKRRAADARHDDASSLLPLSALLSRVLLAFAMEFERQSELSLAISANMVRVLDDQGVRIRDLPLMTGVSKEAISMALGFLQKRGMAKIEIDSSVRRVKLVRLTPKGREAQETYRRRLHTIEERWEVRFGKNTLRNLRRCLKKLVGEPTAQLSPLFRGLEPFPSGWRASVRQPGTLPHYPMVLHRGGYPDGS